MKTILLLFSVSFCLQGWSQMNTKCSVNIYLLNKRVPCWDSVRKNFIRFTPTKEDLQDTPFIKNEEIVSYTFRKFPAKIKGYKRVIRRVHEIKTSVNLNERIDKLELSLLGCARQLVIVVDGEIIYGLCLNNRLSSWVPLTVSAIGVDQSLDLLFYPRLGESSDDRKDLRENKKLFDCLKQTNRFIYTKKKDGF